MRKELGYDNIPTLKPQLHIHCGTTCKSGTFAVKKSSVYLFPRGFNITEI